MPTILTIGHSKHPIEIFVALAHESGVEAVADVRSSPYSRFNPQFNRETLKQALAENGIRYVFLGEELGARSKDPNCYIDGKASYAKIAKTKTFQDGIERVLSGAENMRIALMCAEAEPLDCHRTILVARALVAHGADIAHIHSDGEIETHAHALDRLVSRYSGQTSDLFATREELIEQALKRRGEEIAYQEAQIEPKAVAG